jgi:hypothetical protein|nr:MAG TPA: hypothetical protein [Caudoviricetes sp.]
MQKRLDREEIIGKTYKNNLGQDFTVINYKNPKNIDIKFEDGTIVLNKRFTAVLSGSIRNPNFPIKYGVAFIGQGKYKSTIEGKDTAIYTAWSGILRRCYDKKFLIRNPSYYKTIVCEEWHNFQNFATWFENNWKPYMKGWHVDKDILFKRDKIYSPETCSIVPAEINYLLLKCNASRGGLPIGVFKDGKKYVAKLVRDKGIQKYTRHNTIEEAFQSYKVAKEAHIKEVAEIWRPKLATKTYEALINYQVEITD